MFLPTCCYVAALARNSSFPFVIAEKSFPARAVQFLEHTSTAVPTWETTKKNSSSVDGKEFFEVQQLLL